ncbi:MAG: hypothetical protein R3D44_09205 [Hyphomicrobiaceae bacterium]
MISLADKRKLSKALQTLHGEDWEDGLKPTYDDRGLAAIAIRCFGQIDRIREIASYPIYWLEIEVSDSNDTSSVEAAIELLVRGTSANLEFLQVDRVFDATRPEKDAGRQVLPNKGDVFRGLPAVDRVVFSRINFSDEHLVALASNPTLSHIDIRECDITTKIAGPLSKLNKLEFVLLSDCPGFPSSEQEWLRAKLPKPRVVRVD